MVASRYFNGSVACMIVGLFIVQAIPGALAPDTEPGPKPGGGIGIDAAYPKVNRCELWNETNYAVHWGSLPDVNKTNRQVDPWSSLEYYIWVNISHPISITNFSTVRVYGWFDYGNSTRDSTTMNWASKAPVGYNASSGGNLNFYIWYNVTTNTSRKYWPTNSSELQFNGVQYKSYSNAKDIAFKVRFGNQTRWAPGPPNNFNMTRGYNDLFSWNLFCDVYDNQGNNASVKGFNEFGIYKLTTLSIAGSPSGSAIPGGGRTMLQSNNPQSVSYSSNAPYTLSTNISDLTGSVGTIQRSNVAISGEDIGPPTYFPQSTGLMYVKGSLNESWQNMNPSLPLSPTARSGTPMTYDSARKRIIMSDGSIGASNIDDTYSYTLRTNKWTDLNPSVKPSPARCYHSIAYSSVADRVVLFGGFNSGSPLSDTWAYDNTTNMWINRAPSGSPSSRYGHSMVYDSKADKFILFGGYSTANKWDTWEYDYMTNKWMNRSSLNHPEARYMHSMVYDPLSDRVVLFGGQNGTKYYDSTWIYNYNINTWSNMTTGSPHPNNRREHAMAFDAESNYTILFGGRSSSSSYKYDTWAYYVGGNNWQNMTTSVRPPSRSLMGMAYDALNDRTVIFGGWTSNNVDETWGYDLNTNTWVWMNPPFQGRYQHALAYDWNSNLAIMFGGDTGSSTLDETWAYDIAQNKWTCMAPFGLGPGSLKGHAMAYDAAQKKVVLFGGLNKSGIIKGDTWVYDTGANKWVQKYPSTIPTQRWGAAMTYNFKKKMVAIFGGHDGTSFLDDTWEYNMTANYWTLASGGSRPTPRMHASFVYDFKNDRYVLFGGLGSSGSTNDMWVLTSTMTWTRLFPTQVPSTRYGASMVFDVSNGQPVLFGGTKDGFTYTDDTFKYSDTTNNWTDISKATRPGARFSAAKTFYVSTGKMVITGGKGSSYYSDTWALTMTSWRVNNNGAGLSSRPIYWYVNVPVGQAAGYYWSPITYTIATSYNPVAA